MALAGNRELTTWWVNQNIAHAEEREGAVLWASKTDRRGRHLRHHAALLDVHPGDRVLHYARGKLRGVSVIAEAAVEAPRPYRHVDRELNDEGYLVRVLYRALGRTIDRDAIPLEWRVRESGAFTARGWARRGYLFPLSSAFISELEGAFPEIGEASR